VPWEISAEICMTLRTLSYQGAEHVPFEVKQPRNPWAELGQIWLKNEAKVSKLRQNRWSKEPEIIGFLLVDLVLLCPYPQSSRHETLGTGFKLNECKVFRLPVRDVSGKAPRPLSPFLRAAALLTQRKAHS
jgi:hypothetical protein